MQKWLTLGLKTLVVASGLTIIFSVAAVVSGIGRRAPAAATTSIASTAPTAATGQAAGGRSPAGPRPPAASQPPASARQPAKVLLFLFIASLIQALVVAYLVLESEWGGWKMVGALFLLVLNLWLQAGLESVPYLRGHVSPQFSRLALVMGLVIASLFAPFAVWVLGGFGRGAKAGASERTRWSASRWAGALALTTLAFVALYYLCGYYIAWQNPVLRQFYSGTTEIRSFWGQMAWTWSGTRWMLPFQACRALLFVAMTLPAVRMLRGGAARVAFGTALMYAAWDGSVGLIIPSPIFPASVAHSHMVELAVWGLVFGAFVGWVMVSGRAAAPAQSQVPEAA